MPLKLIPPKEGRSPYYRVRGTHVSVYLDRSTKTTDRATANQFLKRWKEDIERGELARPGEPTFLDAAVNYMAATGNEKFVRPVLEHFGGKPLREINQQEIDHAAIALYANATPATRNRQVYTVVSAILKHAGIDTPLRRPKDSRGRVRKDWLTKPQAFALLKAAHAKDAEYGIMVAFMLYTGARLSEALNLLTDNLDMGEAHAFFTETKNGDPRLAYLPPVLIADLANHPRGLDRKGKKVFRFTKCGRLYSWWDEVNIAAGLPMRAAPTEGKPDRIKPVFTYHTLRHTWATWMRRYGGADTGGLVATGAWRDRTSAARYEHAVVSEEARRARKLPTHPRFGKAAK